MYYFNADTRKHTQTHTQTHRHTHTQTHTQTNKVIAITLLCKINQGLLDQGPGTFTLLCMIWLPRLYRTLYLWQSWCGVWLVLIIYLHVLIINIANKTLRPIRLCDVMRASSEEILGRTVKYSNYMYDKYLVSDNLWSQHSWFMKYTLLKTQ